MKNKLYSTARRKKENIINLFPNYFKKIGIALMLLGLIPAGFISQTDFAFVKLIPKDVMKLITIDLCLVGLLLMAWAKDKIEDEMTMYMRLKAIEWTFMYAVIYVIIAPLLDRILNTSSITDINSKGLIVMMVTVYLIQFNIQKKLQ
ncbi:MAG: hypothetical protein QM541_08150 [Flavobacterium sp.]|nr:hypothetical protein [Flavobacterium sp.]